MRLKHILFAVILFFLHSMSPAFAANRIYYENFDDQDVDPVSYGGITATTTVFTSSTVEGTLDTDYYYTTGYGGTGYCLSDVPSYEEGTVYHAAFIKFLNWSGWTSDEIYMSYRLRFADFTEEAGTEIENNKLLYFYFPGSSSYIAVAFQGTYGGNAIVLTSVRANVSTYLRSTESNWSVNITNGDWVKLSWYWKWSTNEFKFWINDAIFYNDNFTDGLISSGFVGIRIPAEDSTPSPGIFTRQVDNIEIWDGIPGEDENDPPSVLITGTCPRDVTSEPAEIVGTATDSDGTVTGVSWSGDGTGACSADDGTFNGASEAFTCTVQLVEGANNVTITATDNDSATDSDTCTVNYSSESDFTPPSIAITSPTEVAYYNIEETSSINLSGTASDNVGISSVTWTCETCVVTSGSASYAAGAWSITGIQPAKSGYGAELVTDGGFPSFDNWTADEGWTLVDGKASSAGTLTNQSLQQENGSIALYANYIVSYDSDHTSGTLYLSQYGFPGEGNSTLLTTNPDGQYSETVICQGDAILRFSTNDWVGTLDNVSLRQKGTQNIITVTATDTSDNTTDDVLYVNSYILPTMTGVMVKSGPFK